MIWFVAPKYGSKNLFVYIGVCSLIGSLSVVTTQGIGTAIVTTLTSGENQFKEWFFYVLTAFVIVTLLTEINYLNKALNIFNTAMVTPVYYVMFTGLTIISSAILSQGFKAAPISIATVVMGFLVICFGIVLLFRSKQKKENDDDEKSSKNDDSDNSSIEENEFDAFGIRASLGSIRRLSRTSSYPSHNSQTLPTHNKEYNNKEYDNKDDEQKEQPQSPQHIRSQSVRSSAGLPTINESSMNLYSYQEDNRDIDSTIPNDSSINMDESFFSNNKRRETNEPSSMRNKRPPIILTKNVNSSSAFDDTTNSNNPSRTPNQDDNNNNNKYFRHHLSPINTEFYDPNAAITSESYSGTTNHLDRTSSASSRRSQQSLGLVEKIKLGINYENDNDLEGLVGK